jgi:hypothetical protein
MRKKASVSKKKPTLLFTLGAAFILITGGTIAWWMVQRQVPLEDLPVGADVLPETTLTTFSFTTNSDQWRQLRQYGTPESRAGFEKSFQSTFDRLFTTNGINYEQDVKPWVGGEVTIAFLTPNASLPLNSPSPAPIQPANPLGSAENPPFVMVLPVAKPLEAKQLLGQPRLAAGQEWADRDYKGVKIREVHSQSQLAYAGTLLDDRLLVVSNDAKALEQVIDTYKGGPAIARSHGFGQAWTQLKETPLAPFARIYVNVPVLSQMVAQNPALPIPPQVLGLLFHDSEGVATNLTLGNQGMRFQGVVWLPADSQIRYKVANNAQRMTSLLPAETVLMASGSDLRQTWQEYSQPDEKSPASARVAAFNPDAFRTSVTNLTGFNLDKDLMPWMSGEYAFALVSAPPSATSSTATAGLLFLLQTNDRRAADQAFQRLDETMRQRYRFQVSQAQVGSQLVVSWVSPYTALSATRGWLDGNVAYLAIGPGMADTVAPPAARTLAAENLFQQTTAKTFEQRSGYLYLEPEYLVNASGSNPLLPKLLPENRALLNTIRAIGVTTAVQNGQSFQFDAQMLLRQKGPPSDPLPLSPGSPSGTAPPAPPALSPSP